MKNDSNKIQSPPVVEQGKGEVNEATPKDSLEKDIAEVEAMGLGKGEEAIKTAITNGIGLAAGIVELAQLAAKYKADNLRLTTSLDELKRENDNLKRINRELNQQLIGTDEELFYCGECKQTMTIVRPGKHICNNTECKLNN